jgi:hypothetical protein
MAARKQRLPEPEELFLDYVKRMTRHREGREVVLVHMSKLEMMNRTRHHGELVTSLLAQTAHKFDGRVFRFMNGDIACITRNASAGHIDNLLFEIRYGFSDDALVQAEDAGQGTFIETFDVRWDFEAVEVLARDRFAALKQAEDASTQAAKQEEAGAKETPSGASKPASLLNMDKGLHGVASASGKAGQRDTKEVVREVARPPKTAPLREWLSQNALVAGGAVLELVEVVTPVPVYELGAVGHPDIGATIRISQSALAQAYTQSVGMKMNERLQDFLMEEAEGALVSLLGSLVPPPSTPGGVGVRPFERSVCLAPGVVLSPAFLLAVKVWSEAGEKGSIFWFSPEVFDPGTHAMGYIVDFLHDMGQFVGVRGVIPGETGSLAARLPRMDGWSLKWPDMDLRRVPQGELDGLGRVLERWGPDYTFLQGINSEDKVRASLDFGFRFAECTDAASRKLFGR